MRNIFKKSKRSRHAAAGESPAPLSQRHAFMLSRAADAQAHSNQILNQLIHELQGVRASCRDRDLENGMHTDPHLSAEGGLPSQPPKEAQPSDTCPKPKADPAAQEKAPFSASPKATSSPLRAFFCLSHNKGNPPAPTGACHPGGVLIYGGFIPETPTTRALFSRLEHRGDQGLCPRRTMRLTVMGRKSQIKFLTEYMTELEHLCIYGGGFAKHVAKAMQKRFPGKVTITSSPNLSIADLAYIARCNATPACPIHTTKEARSL